ncbi:hypothetical protein L6R52_33215, partial [Myxococcota bacterium]|nr:hypothetical protein [Myxococcota bacterium]
MQKPSLLALSILAPLALACGATCPVDDPAGVLGRVDDPSRPLADFLAHPWPSDARLRNDGSLDLAAFPNPTESTTLEDYVRVISAETKGYATSAALYASFTGPIDPASLPADPAAAMRADASLFLVDVDPRSPERG